MKKYFYFFAIILSITDVNAQITTRISDGSRFLPNAAWTIKPFHGTRGTAFADLNGDGRADAIFLNDLTVTVKPSSGSMFAELVGAQPWVAQPYQGTRGTFFADVNGDKRSDMISVNNVEVGVRLSGGNKFLSHSAWSTVPYFGSRGTFFADVNGDRKSDAIVVNDGGITVRLSNGTRFLENARWTREAYFGSLGTYFADVNGDGKADAIVINEDMVTVRLSDGSKFLPNVAWTQEPYFGSRGNYFADVNGDKKADAIVINNDLVTVRLSDGTKFIPNASWTAEPYFGMNGTYFADANGDGKADAIVINTARVDDAELAYHHAPIHFQDTDSDDPKADYITAVNYDNTWSTTDNWDHIFDFPLAAKGYYSVVETCTHWYITYAFYHPRDWGESIDDVHENDLEGIILMVRKDGSTFGKIEGGITIAHSGLFSFVPDGSPLKEGRTINGKLSFMQFDGSDHPVTSQEAKGHGMKAFPFIGDFSGKSDEDGIIYFPNRNIAQVPRSGNDRQVMYQLVDIMQTDGLWDRQLLDIKLSRNAASVFAKFGGFKGDGSGSCGAGAPVCLDDGADAPWNWDGTGTDSHRGDWALDPANLFEKFYQGLGVFSRQYLSNKYVSDLQKMGFTSNRKPRGWNDAIDINNLFKKLVKKCQ